MSEKKHMKQKNKKCDFISNRRNLLRLLFATGIILALLVGLTYAWFFSQSNMATLLEIKEPSDISIFGPNGSEMSSIDLNYTDSDKTGDTVTVKRVFCVQTGEDKHRLEIAHTTNMKGLNFKIYKVDSNGTESVTEDGIEYKYNAQELAGNYINQDDAKSTVDYKYATGAYHDENYSGSSSFTQTHAEPVYWLASDELQTNKTGESVEVKGKTYYRTYYVCEVSWTETEKETDIFYILAKNVTH